MKYLLAIYLQQKLNLIIFLFDISLIYLTSTVTLHKKTMRVNTHFFHITSHRSLLLYYGNGI